MRVKVSTGLGRLSWTVAGFGAFLGIKLASNIVLAHLLSPSVFGVVVVVTTIRFGIELLADAGIEQNIVRHEKGLDPRFFNTAWTLQMIRGALLSVVFLALSPWLAGFYGIDVGVFLIISFAPLLNSLHSTSVFVLSKGLDTKGRSLFELKADILSFVITVTLVVVWPTIWAVLVASLLSITARSILSYRLPHPKHSLIIDRKCTTDIIRFGKWIAISSLLLYAGTSLDRMMLGRLAPLEILGIYGLAKIIADLPPFLASRLSHQIAFPSIAAARTAGQMSHAAVARPRGHFLLVASALMATGISWADVAVRLMYDSRYYQAAWMLSLLLIGSWFAIISSLGEALLLGVGRPAFMSLANVVRVGVLGVGLPLGYMSLGMPGAILAFTAGEVARYLVVTLGQQRFGHSFWKQDVVATVVGASLLTVWVVVRLMTDLGVPWSGLTFGH